MLLIQRLLGIILVMHLSHGRQIYEASEYGNQDSRESTVISSNNSSHNTSLKFKHLGKFGNTEDSYNVRRNLPVEASTLIEKFWNPDETKENIRNAQALLLKMYMDPTVEPCDDFYNFTCGNWEKYHPARNAQDRTCFFTNLFENLQNGLYHLLNSQTSYHDYHPNNAELKAQMLYESCMDMDKRKRIGIQPLLELFDSWGGWPILKANWNSQNFDWLHLTAQMRLYGCNIFIYQSVGPDYKNATENIIHFFETTLGLGEHNYYVKVEYDKKLNAYKNLMSDIFQKMGVTTAKSMEAANKLLQFEIQLAFIVSKDNSTAMLDSTRYNRLNLSKLQALLPEIDWLQYLTIVQQRTVTDSEEVVMHSENYMADFVRLIKSTDAETIANYMFWRFFHSLIDQLDESFDKIKQDFDYNFHGLEGGVALWQYCVNEANIGMDMAVGSMFVRQYFHENSKKDVRQIAKKIKQAFRENLKTLDWLDDVTKQQAKLKINAMTLLVGYPDYILDSKKLTKKYIDLLVTPDKFLTNILSILLHKTRKEQKKLFKPVDRNAWVKPPAKVNAFYVRNRNQMLLPAAILQAPYYHPYFPRAVTIGGIGAMIGHEMIHGFDIFGRNFDFNGNLRNWWSNSSLKGFEKMAQCTIEQYGNYTVGNVSVHGEKTAGENIADNAGLKFAFQVYSSWLKNNPDSISDEQLPGLNMTAEQLFFLSNAHVYCSSYGQEAMAEHIESNEHTPERHRVIGMFSNIESFSKAFNCPIGSPMNPENKCSLW